MKPNITDTYTNKGMRYPAINDLIDKATNKYELVLATAKRAREIVDGSEPLVKITIDNPVSIATAEIAEELVTLVNPSFAEAADQDNAEPQFPEDDTMLGEMETTADLAENL